MNFEIFKTVNNYFHILKDIYTHRERERERERERKRERERIYYLRHLALDSEFQASK